MSIVCSDFHGNKAKLEAFLAHRPDVEHVIAGDFMDSYCASDADIIETFDRAVEAGCTLLAGNHELPYLSNAHAYFRCSGNRYTPELFQTVNRYKHLLHGSIIRDGCLIVHGGLSAKHGKPFATVEEACEWINTEWDWYKNCPVVPETLSSIFDIGYNRGGYNDVSGPFWCSIGHDNIDKRFPQVVGHTCRADPLILEEGKKGHTVRHVGIDSPKYVCYNTETHELEDFMPEQYKHDEQFRKMLERKF